MGKPQEGILTLQSLVQRNPQHLTGWLRLTALLLETGKVQHAITTLKELTTIHPRYQEGHAILHRLEEKCRDSHLKTPSFPQNPAIPARVN